MASVFGNKGTHNYINNHFFLFFFWIGDVKHICTHFKKHVYFTKNKSRTFKWTLFVGDGGARMYINSIIKPVISMFVMAKQS